MPAIPRLAPARIALVGDRSPQVRAHQRIPAVLDALHSRDGLGLDAYWVATGDIHGDGDLAGFDGVWLVPGSPYRSEAGALIAVRTAREGGIPFLGTCGGFQHAVLEFARNVCGVPGAANAEVSPAAPDLVIVPMTCSLAGHEGTVRLTAGSLAERVLGVRQTVERYQCSYGVSPAHVGLLTAHGLRFTGLDEDGDVRVAELPSHPFYLLTLFQPELADGPRHPHPVVRAFGQAVVARAGTTPAGPAGAGYPASVSGSLSSRP